MKQNYKVFSVTMAAFLSDYKGHPIVAQYFSEARNCKVWEFKKTPEFIKDANTYIAEWKSWKEAEGVEIDGACPEVPEN